MATIEVPAATLTSSDAQQARRRRHALLLVVLWAAIYIPGLFSPALLDDADTVHAEAARMMLVRHDWVTLYIDGNVNPPQSGVRYLEKAPLQYWLTAICYKLFGISEWTTRLPLALTSLALALFLLHFGRRFYGDDAGFFAGMIVLTAFGAYLFTRFFIPDLIVGLWLAIGVYCFLTTLEQEKPSRAACWGFAIAAALSVLSKGLIGVLFPVGIVVLYLVLTQDLKHVLKMRPVSSTLIFLAIAAPWHILAGLRNPAAGQSRGFFWFYFVNEHVNRFLGTRYPKDYDKVPLILFWGLTLVWLLPWTVFLPQAVRQVPARIRDWSNLERARRATLVCGIWTLLIFVFFSFSTRQEYYIVPTLPALGLLLGAWLGKECGAAAAPGTRRSGRTSAAALFAIGIVIFAVTMWLAWQAQTPAPGTDIATLLAQHPQDYALSMGHFLDLTPQALGAFREPLIWTGIFFLMGTGASWLFRRRGRPFAGNLALGAMMVGFLYCAHVGFETFSPVLSSKPLAQAIAREYRPGDVIVVNGKYEWSSSVNFYTGIQVHILNHIDGNMWYGSLFPDAPAIFETDQSFRKLWESPSRIFLFSDANAVPAELMRNPIYKVAQGGGKIVLSNQPN